jgi:plasmid stability protein
MRTTLNLDDDLMRTVKRRAAETGQTMTQIIEAALREMMTRPSTDPGGNEFEWVTVRGSVRPGVDVSDRDSLFDVMEDGR